MSFTNKMDEKKVDSLQFLERRVGKIQLVVGLILLIGLGFLVSEEWKNKTKLYTTQLNVSSPSPNLNNKIDNVRPIPAQLNTINQAQDNKNIKANCVSNVRKYISNNKNKQLSQSDIVFSINSIYRICLAENGLPPEDLLSSSGNSFESANSVDTGATGTTSNDWVRESKQKCQQETIEYNSCLSEYNAKMAEYNQCQLESYDPDSYRYKGFCFKPSKYCSKPLCNL